MKKYLPISCWFISSVIVACLIQLAVTDLGLLDLLIAMVASAAITIIVLTVFVKEDGFNQVLPPQHHHFHHYPENDGCYDGPEDDGYDGWLDLDQPRPPRPFPPSRN